MSCWRFVSKCGEVKIWWWSSGFSFLSDMEVHPVQVQDNVSFFDILQNNKRYKAWAGKIYQHVTCLITWIPWVLDFRTIWGFAVVYGLGNDIKHWVLDVLSLLLRKWTLSEPMGSILVTPCSSALGFDIFIPDRIQRQQQKRSSTM